MKKPAELERKIYFYKTSVSLHRQLTPSYDFFADYHLRLNNDFTNLIDRNFIYTSPVDDKLYFLETKMVTPDKIKAIFYLLRINDFPYLFNLLNGQKDAITNSDDDTLMEQTHFIMYPKLNLIVAEYNHNSARIEKLKWFLQNQYTGLDFEAKPIVIPDFYKKIANMEKINSVTFKLSHLGLETLVREANLPIDFDFEDTFHDTHDLTIELSISGGSAGLKPKDKKKFLGNLVEYVKNRKNAEYTRKKDIPKGHVRGIMEENSRVIPIDIFDEKLLKEVKVHKISSSAKYVNSEEMFNLIEEAFKEKYSEFIHLMAQEEAAITK